MAAQPKSVRSSGGARAGVTLILFAAASFSFAVWGDALTRNSRMSDTSQSTSSSQPQEQEKSSTNATPNLPRGKKLILKDGNYQLVREYKVEGDRVRYYSVDSRQWEEMPASYVDWDATHKVEAEEAKVDAAEVGKVRAREQARNGMPLDIDASLEAAPNVFIPPGEGAFVFEGKAVVPLTPAETDAKNDKGRTFKQVLVPIPIVPSRRIITIPGTRSKQRIKSSQPEFYMRTGDAHEPEMQLIHTKVKGYSRFIENVDTLFKEETVNVETLPMQKWLIARGVYRFTLGQSLPPGEYALAEVVRAEGINIYVWDFGVDGSGPASTSKAK
jgi:hypothetical protein